MVGQSFTWGKQSGVRLNCMFPMPECLLILNWCIGQMDNWSFRIMAPIYWYIYIYSPIDIYLFANGTFISATLGTREMMMFLGKITYWKYSNYKRAIYWWNIMTDKANLRTFSALFWTPIYHNLFYKHVIWLIWLASQNYINLLIPKYTYTFSHIYRFFCWNTFKFSDNSISISRGCEIGEICW